MQVGELLVKINAETQGLQKGVSKAQSILGSLGKITAFGGITYGLYRVGKAVFDMGVQFEQTMANVNSVLGGSEDELRQLTKLAREWGKKSVFSANQVGQAMYYIASAGYKADQVTQSLNATLTLAQATGAELAFTTSTLIGTINQFGLSASDADRVANVFAATIANSQATIEKLATSMTYAGTMAHQIGLSLEQTSAALGILYNAGYQASQAGTALRMAFASLLSPTKAAEETLNKLGVTLTDSEGKMRDFYDILQDLADSGMTAADAIEIFGVRSGPAIMQLVSHIDELKQFEQAIKGTAKASEMAAKQTATVGSKLAILKNRFGDIALGIYEIFKPAIDLALNALLSLTDATGPVASALGELFYKLQEPMSKFIDFLGGSMYQFFYQDLPNMVNATKDSFNTLISSFQELWNGLKTVFVEWPSELIQTGSQLVGALAMGIAQKYEGIKSVFNEIWSIFWTSLNSWAGSMSQWGSHLIEAFISGIKSAWERLKQGIIDIAEFIKGLFHHSKPDFGPLAFQGGSRVWGKHFMENFVQGALSASQGLNMISDVLSNVIPDANMQTQPQSVGYGQIVINYSNNIPPEELVARVSNALRTKRL